MTHTMWVNELSEKTKIKLTFVCQLKIKRAADYLLHAILKDENSGKLYLCALALNEIQRFRLQSSLKCITFAEETFSDYYYFNKPIWAGTLRSLAAEVVMYLYYADAKRIDSNSELPIQAIDKIYSKIEPVKVTNELLLQVSNNILKYNFPEYSYDAVLRSKPYNQYMELLSKMDTVQLVNSHLDYSPSNIMICQEKTFLIDFEQGAESIPIGYDKLHYLMYQNKVEKNKIPYYELNKFLYGVYHISKEELGQEKYNPMFSYASNQIIVQEDKKRTKINPVKIRDKVVFLDFDQVYLEPFTYKEFIERMLCEQSYKYVIVANAVWDIYGVKKNSCDCEVEVFSSLRIKGGNIWKKITNHIMVKYWTYRGKKILKRRGNDKVI